MTRARQPAAVLSLLILAGCGAANPGATSSKTPTIKDSASGTTATPSATGELLFVVLEARGPNSHLGPEPDVADAFDRVAIVGLDGYARAKADFTPRKIPTVGNAGAVLQPEARVAGTHVFYIDGAGVVRELSRSGTTSAVTTFSLQSQQELSFAASADGANFEASRITFPRLNPNGTSIADMFLLGPYRYELLRASRGGQAQSVVNRETDAANVTQFPEVVGWDESGPLATISGRYGTQQSTQGRRAFGQLVHLSASGQPGPVLGGADCSIVMWSGKILLCTDQYAAAYTVRTPDGKTLWSLPARPPATPYSNVVLSPDTSQIAYQGGVTRRDGSSISLAQAFFPEGWLDNQTLIGVTGQNDEQEMATVRLAAPNTVNDLGFKGEFIGVLPAG